MRAVILARVSTSKQEKEGLSLDMQLQKLREYGSSKDFEIAKEFVFSESADQKIRNKFTEMIEFIKKHKDIKSVIAFRVDRLTRNFRDQVLIDELVREHGIEIHLVDDRLIINNNTVGRDIQDWDLKVFLGKLYINRLREDAKNSADYKLGNGQWPGKAHFGYKNVTLEDGKKWVEPDGIKATIVRLIFEWYGTGTTSMNLIRQKIAKEFDIKLSRGKIDQILNCKFYHGTMLYRGDEYPHKYETLITQDLFNQAQEIKKSYNKKSGHKFAGLPFPYRGLIKCAHCGASISPERKIKKKSGKQYIYYCCTEYFGPHKAKNIREEELTRQFTEIFEKIRLPLYVKDTIDKSLKESTESKGRFYTETFEHLNAEHLKYANRIQRIYYDLIDNRITASDHDRMLADFKYKQKEITSKLQRLEKADDEYYQNVLTVLAIATEGADLFKSSKMELKRLLIKNVLSNLRLDGENLVYEWAKPYDCVFAHANSGEWLPGRGSNLGHQSAYPVCESNRDRSSF